MKAVYVLYGSQTGNAECISKDVEAKLTEMEIPCICMTLNAAKKVSIKEEARFAVVICSTTGNGDAPENADAWWRSIKLRSAVSVYWRKGAFLYSDRNVTHLYEKNS